MAAPFHIIAVSPTGRAFTVDVLLPGLNSSEQVNLEVSASQIAVESQAVYTRLEVDLPRAVVPGGVTARFKRKSGLLRLKLPFCPSAEPAPFEPERPVEAAANAEASRTQRLERQRESLAGQLLGGPDAVSRSAAAKTEAAPVAPEEVASTEPRQFVTREAATETKVQQQRREKQQLKPEPEPEPQPEPEPEPEPETDSLSELLGSMGLSQLSLQRRSPSLPGGCRLSSAVDDAGGKGNAKGARGTADSHAPQQLDAALRYAPSLTPASFQEGVAGLFHPEFAATAAKMNPILRRVLIDDQVNRA